MTITDENIVFPFNAGWTSKSVQSSPFSGYRLPIEPRTIERRMFILRLCPMRRAMHYRRRCPNRAVVPFFHLLVKDVKFHRHHQKSRPSFRRRPFKTHIVRISVRSDRNEISPCSSSSDVETKTGKKGFLGLSPTGTNADVFIRLIDRQGTKSDVMPLKGSTDHRNKFERGQTDEFDVGESIAVGPRKFVWRGILSKRNGETIERNSTVGDLDGWKWLRTRLVRRLRSRHR